MNQLRRVSPAAFSLLLLTACVAHNVPTSPTPNGIKSQQTAEAFVDQNGTFYPANWSVAIGRPPASGLRSAFSLKAIAHNKGSATEALLAAEEERVLDELEEFLRAKRRVFILIHGFNSHVNESREAYTLIENAIVFEPSDAILEFHWDGLVAKGPFPINKLGAGKIWFNAAGYSQLAGARGLRRILNRLEEKEILIIAHSRGASVALSAFSDPPYATSFGWATKKLHDIDVWQNDPVRDNRNRIKAIFLAPAIGEMDFRTVHYYHGDWSYRPFGAQVKRIIHTVNLDDPVLRKPFGLSNSFNPTNLGYNATVTTAIAPHYEQGFLTYVDLQGLNSHDFRDYVRHQSFKPILNSLGIRTRE